MSHTDTLTPKTVGTRCLVHQSHRCMLDMCLSRYAAASALLTKSDRSLQKNCSECVTAPPRNHRSLRSRIPVGRVSHAWLSHAPRATTEANTLRCTTEVPVLVNYLSFFDGTGPAAPGVRCFIISNLVPLSSVAMEAGRCPGLDHIAGGASIL